ncbi:hypothetical protein [Geodermatophilus sp. TF02-6]|uniref:hypothetical protein n=1 Tax=Geodermatophilus sp. TF02-6 TaxID=2250575 RepID=UPI0011BD53C3|nr:hypothetical protein [Geodermatophilus sp. TF02-6]
MGDPLWQRMMVAATGPTVTALLALLVVNLVAARIQRRKDESELREALAGELTEVANSLFLALQVFERTARHVPLEKRKASEAIAEQRGDLDHTYFSTRTRSQVLERRLQIHYADKRPAQAWHAVTDLLMVRYFLLLEADAGFRRWIRRQAAGPDHSGLSEEQLDDPGLLLESYRSALDDCVKVLWLSTPDRRGRHLKRGEGTPLSWHRSEGSEDPVSEEDGRVPDVSAA